VQSAPTNPPIQIMSRYKDVTVACDIIYVNTIPFFMFVSRHIKFGTAEMITSETVKTLLTANKQVKRAYAQRGFALRTMLLDGQFEPLRADLAGIGIGVNGVARDEHVPEIERYIRTTKERTRCIYTMLPFEKIPARITIEMIYASVFWLNMFPLTDGVSTTHSPRNIICGHQLDYKTHCKLEFGTYAQVHMSNAATQWPPGLLGPLLSNRPVTPKGDTIFIVYRLAGDSTEITGRPFRCPQRSSSASTNSSTKEARPAASPLPTAPASTHTPGTMQTTSTGTQPSTALTMTMTSRKLPTASQEWMKMGAMTKVKAMTTTRPKEKTTTKTKTTKIL
jgi:hypothetical protein